MRRRRRKVYSRARRRVSRLGRFKNRRFKVRKGLTRAGIRL